MSELDRLRERVRQNRNIRNAAIGRYAGSLGCAEESSGCTLRPGARVFDRVTGEEGEVIRAERTNLVDAAPQRSND